MLRKKNIKIKEIKLGEEILQDLFSLSGQLLVRKGTIMKQDIIDSLQRRGNLEFYVSEAEAVNKAEQVYSEAMGHIKDFMKEIREKKKINYELVEETVECFNRNVINDIDLLETIFLIREKDEYLYSHSLNVGILNLLISKWLQLDIKSIKNIALAGIVHDVGKLLVSGEILHKPAKLSPIEWQKMQRHSELGYRLCVDSGRFKNNIACAVMMHHERMDGSGYPQRLKQDNILREAMITSISDTYDAITSKRVYADARNVFKALEVLYDESMAGKIDYRISRIFIDKILTFAIGDEVILSDGQRGSVVFTNSTKPSRPMIKVGANIIDLASRKDLDIVERIKIT